MKKGLKKIVFLLMLSMVVFSIASVSWAKSSKNDSEAKSTKKSVETQKKSVKTQKKVVKAKKVTITNKKKSMAIGEEYKFKAKITPKKVTNDSIKWMSSNKKIATVSKDGVVKGIAKGKVTITAKTHNGKTAKVKVTIKKVKVEKLEITCDKDCDKNKDVIIGDKMVCSLKVEPKNATLGDVKWSSSDSKVAKVDKKGNVVAKGLGKAVIKAKSSEGSVAEYEVNVKLSKTEWGVIMFAAFLCMCQIIYMIRKKLKSN